MNYPHTYIFEEDAHMDVSTNIHRHSTIKVNLNLTVEWRRNRPSNPRNYIRNKGKRGQCFRRMNNDQ